MVNNLLFGSRMPDGTPIRRVPMSEYGISTNFREADHYPEDLLVIEIREFLHSLLSDVSQVDRITDQFAASLAASLAATPRTLPMSDGEAAGLILRNLEAVESTRQKTSQLVQSLSAAAENGVSRGEVEALVTAVTNNAQEAAADLRYASGAYDAISAALPESPGRIADALTNVESAREVAQIAHALQARTAEVTPRLSAGQILSRALEIAQDRVNSPAARLRALVGAIEAPPAADLTEALADCLPRAYAAFVAYYGRAGNRADVELAADPAKLRVADLEHLLEILPQGDARHRADSSFEPLEDVPKLTHWLHAFAGTMALFCGCRPVTADTAMCSGCGQNRPRRAPSCGGSTRRNRVCSTGRRSRIPPMFARRRFPSQV